MFPAYSLLSADDATTDIAAAIFLYGVSVLFVVLLGAAVSRMMVGMTEAHDMFMDTVRNPGGSDLPF